MSDNLERVLFGAGCFWGVEESFRHIRGVVDTAVGYSGGKTENPTYEQVCSKTTGHAEVVEVVFDPGKVTFSELLDAFWECHDPTQLNRQGPDVGDQYRTAIYYTSEAQRETAESSKKRMQDSPKFQGRTIVTEIAPAQTFWRAEEYHQRFLAKRGMSRCH